MPYITQSERKKLENVYIQPSNPGELNYVIFKRCLQEVKEKGASYNTFNDIIGSLDRRKISCKCITQFENDINDILFLYREGTGAYGVLECVKLEFYRRVVAPYEDKKMEENGDVV